VLLGLNKTITKLLRVIEKARNLPAEVVVVIFAR
jgi:hypothetical protein